MDKEEDGCTEETEFIIGKVIAACSRSYVGILDNFSRQADPEVVLQRPL